LNFSLAGKVALVTGSSRGIGLGMARGLAEAGAHVVLNGRDEGTLVERARELAQQGLRASHCAFDVTDEAGVRDGVANVVRAHGTLHILIANAGTHHARPLAEWTLADWRRVMAANLDAAFLLAREAAAPMIAQRDGRIIFTSSLTSLLGRPTIHAYAASKAGLNALTRTLAAELAPHGITCNAILPGYVETELSAKLRQDVAMVQRITSRIPLGRWAVPEDLAGLAVFLASPAASYITAQSIVVDGGMGSML